MGETKIEWTDTTWNPLRGCTEISPGCVNCYAAELAVTRLAGPGQAYEGLAYRDGNGKTHWAGRIQIVPGKLHEPLSWRKPRMVFVNSMSDLFHEDVPEGFILDAFDVMRRCTWAGGQDCGRIGGSGHTFQVLTKRAERAADVLSRLCWDGEALNLDGNGTPMLMLNDQIWVGVSVENRRHGLPRIGHLRRVPARMRFLSIEPLLEGLGPIDLTGMSWCIVGGESGPGFRLVDVSAITSVVSRCRAAGVPVFVKQDCGRAPGKQGRIPDDIWATKEFPEAAHA